MNMPINTQQTIQQQINQHRQEINLPPVYEQRQFMQPLIHEQIQMSTLPPVRTQF